MAIEERRGCGYRKVGGLYLIGSGMVVPCDRLPHNLEVCPICGQGIKFSRGFTWVSGELLGDHEGCTEEFKSQCPVCSPLDKGKLGLMFVGSRFYTPESFVKEAAEMGVCKRIISVPKGLVLGETWVLLAHPKAGTKKVERTKEEVILDARQGLHKLEPAPAIFYAFKPRRIEKLIKQSEAIPKELEKLQKRGITPIVVPDNDLDHQGSVWGEKTVYTKQCTRDKLRAADYKCGTFETTRKRARCPKCGARAEVVSERKESRRRE